MRRSYGDFVINMGMSLILSSPTEDPKTPLHKGNHLPNIHANVRSAPVSSKTYGDSSSYIQAVKACVNLHSVVSDAKVSKPALLLDDSCLNVSDYSLSLVGKVKGFSSLPNLKMHLVPSFETAGLRPETDHLIPKIQVERKFFIGKWLLDDMKVGSFLCLAHNTFSKLPLFGILAIDDDEGSSTIQNFSSFYYADYHQPSVSVHGVYIGSHMSQSNRGILSNQSSGRLSNGSPKVLSVVGVILDGTEASQMAILTSSYWKAFVFLLIARIDGVCLAFRRRKYSLVSSVDPH
ncbi:hypothetical protein Tco_0557936 [Tanacetum coccineum]